MTEITRRPEAHGGHDLIPAPDAQENAARVYVASLGTEASRRTMWAALERIADIATEGALNASTLPWYALRFEHVAAIRARLMDDLAPSTVNKYLSALRGTLRVAWQMGQMSGDDYHAAVDVKGVRNERLPAGRALTPGEIGALMTACGADDSPAGTRDAAMIGLLYAAGLRRAELVGLDLGDYDPETGELRVRGKGNKERLAWINNGAKAALDDWLDVRGDDPGAMFWAVNKGGNMEPGRLTPQAVYNMLDKRAEEAGVKETSPHDLRRTFVSDLLDAGADIATVQKMAGHANVQTTARYDRRPEAAKRKAANLLHVPYRSK